MRCRHQLLCIKQAGKQPAGGLLVAGETGAKVAGGEGELLTGQQAAFPEVQPPPYWLPEVSGAQVPSAAALVQQ